MNRPIVLNPTIFAEIIYYGEAIDSDPADIAGWGAVRVRNRQNIFLKSWLLYLLFNQRKNEGLPTVVLRSTKVTVVNDDDQTQDGCKTFANYNRNYMMCAKPDSNLGIFSDWNSIVSSCNVIGDFTVCIWILGTPAGSPCQFDEGSPLVQVTPDGKKVVGILSRVRVCDTETPAVYTRIVSYYSWVSAILISKKSTFLIFIFFFLRNFVFVFYNNIFSSIGTLDNNRKLTASSIYHKATTSNTD